MNLEWSCPSCGSEHVEVIETRICSNRTRRRRHGCLTCKHRWTTWSGDRPPVGGVPGKRKRPQPRRSALTDEQIRTILLSRDLNNAEMGRMMNRSPEAIRQIRIGTTSSHRLPKIPRWNQESSPQPGIRSCYGCKNWDAGKCSFGFPDPLEEGPEFALDCDLYAA